MLFAKAVLHSQRNTQYAVKHPQEIAAALLYPTPRNTAETVCSLYKQIAGSNMVGYILHCTPHPLGPRGA